MRRLFFVLLACGAAVAASLAGLSTAGVRSPQSTAAPSTAAVTSITVHMTEYAFQLSANSAPVGTVSFRIINDGKAQHNFSIAGKTSPTLAAGESATMSVSFASAGSQPYLCTLPGHADAGMQGVLTVTGGSTVKLSATINATLKDFRIVLTTRSGAKVRSVKRGLIRLNVKNTGRVQHNIVFRGKGGTKVLKHNQRTVLNVVLTKAGRYYYFCSVKGHAAAGMKGYLRVT